MWLVFLCIGLLSSVGLSQSPFIDIQAYDFSLRVYDDHDTIKGLAEINLIAELILLNIGWI